MTCSTHSLLTRSERHRKRLMPSTRRAFIRRAPLAHSKHSPFRDVEKGGGRRTDAKSAKVLPHSSSLNSRLPGTVPSKQLRETSPVVPTRVATKPEVVVPPTAAMVPNGAAAAGAIQPNRGLPPVGGRLCHFADQWPLITSDKFVLRSVANGYEVEFTGSCRVTRSPVWTPTPSDPAKRQVIEAEIASMLSKGAVTTIDPAREPPGFFSNLFLVGKKSGGLRPILNLSGLNESVIPQKFRQETLGRVQKSLGLSARRHALLDTDPDGPVGPWAVSLDLKDAYFHVKVASRHTRYLRFGYDGVCYEYQVLPFGLSTAPRTFTRIVRTVAGFLRKKGVEMFQYLDDWPIVGQSREECIRNRDLAHYWTVKLGFLINIEKSDWVPSTEPVFIGARLNLLTNLSYPTDERVEDIVVQAAQLAATTVSTARTWRSFIGRISSAIELIPNAKLHMRPLQLCFNAQWSPITGHVSDPVRLSPEARTELLWWTSRANVAKGRPFLKRDPELTIVTDASHIGWGGTWAI